MRCPDCNVEIHPSSLESEMVADGLTHLKGMCQCGEMVHFLCDGFSAYAWTHRRERILSRTLIPLTHSRSVLLIPPDTTDFNDAVKRYLVSYGRRCGIVADETFREMAEPYSQIFPVILWEHSVFATSYLVEKVMAEHLSGDLYSSGKHIHKRFSSLYE